jgi:hypothetical protein
MFKHLIFFFLGLSLLPPSSLHAQSPRQAFWRSLILPGWGQHYAGGGGLRFAAAELGLWAGYLGLRGLEEVRQNHYQSFAAQHAGARPSGKDREYFDDLGFYQSRLQHDQYALYDQGPQARLYPAGPEYFWEWDSEAARQEYRKLRNRSANAGRQALYATGLVAANRVIAAIHAARLARRGKAAALPVELEVDPWRGRVALRRALW